MSAPHFSSEPALGLHVLSDPERLDPAVHEARQLSGPFAVSASMAAEWPSLEAEGAGGRWIALFPNPDTVPVILLRSVRFPLVYPDANGLNWPA